jgi:hypothetical protein
MNAIAVIPCRMGSKRIPRKNLQEIERGISLVRYAVDCAAHAGYFAGVFVVTDDASQLPSLPGCNVLVCPPALCGDLSDIADVSRWALGMAGSFTPESITHVATLQPAVLARSPIIVCDLMRAATAPGVRGGLTMAASHPWTWTEDAAGLHPRWDGAPGYPRSQHLPRTRCEINAVQVATAEDVRAGRRWGWPLAVLELPSWSQALDIDTQQDLEQARAIWPVALPLLSNWRGKITVHQGPAHG